MNRGIARRVIFCDRRDMRAFLAIAAYQVRCGRLEILAFCLMGTHFHMLVRSPRGELSEAMRQIENRYVRYFNRRYRRDGPLFRGRFRSKLVECDDYRRILIRYIDDNPVTAKNVATPGAYEFGSARCWLTQKFPPWLEDRWIRECIAEEVQDGMSVPQAYNHVFGSPTGDQREWIETHQASPQTAEPLAIFLSNAPARVRQWMLRKANLADGTRPAAPVVGVDAVRRVLAEMSGVLSQTQLQTISSRVAAAEVLQVMLLRQLCGMPWRDVARIMQIPLSTAHRRYATHRAEIALDGAYAPLAVCAAQRAARVFVS